MIITTLATPAAACGISTSIETVGAIDTPSLGKLGPEQVANGAIIVQVGIDMKIPVRGQIIAVATAMQESRLYNVNYGDRDSLGLFQQRPSAGWGTPEQVTDPKYASRKFYEALLKVDGWADMPLTKAAQRVQRSAFPDAYAKHEPGAAALVSAVSTGSVSCANYVGWVQPVFAPVGSGFRTSDRPTHQGVDLIAPRNTKVKAAASGEVVWADCDVSGSYHCQTDGSTGTGGCGWYVDLKHPDDIYTRYCHMNERPFVKVGDEVQAGTILGLSGTTGHSSGPHLHFEVHLGDRTKDTATDPVPFMRDHGAPLGEKPPEALRFRPRNTALLIDEPAWLESAVRPTFSIFAPVAVLRTLVSQRGISTYSDQPRGSRCPSVNIGPQWTGR